MSGVKIPANCAVGMEYYGGLRGTYKQGLIDAQQCAEALTKATGKTHTVVTRVADSSDGLPSWVPELWHRVIGGK